VSKTNPLSHIWRGVRLAARRDIIAVTLTDHMGRLATISVLYFSLIAGGDCRAASGYPDNVPVLKEEPNGRMLSPSDRAG
jgi:hypothetical protein